MVLLFIIPATAFIRVVTPKKTLVNVLTTDEKGVTTENV